MNNCPSPTESGDDGEEVSRTGTLLSVILITVLTNTAYCIAAYCIQQKEEGAVEQLDLSDRESHDKRSNSPSSLGLEDEVVCHPSDSHSLQATAHEDLLEKQPLLVTAQSGSGNSPNILPLDKSLIHQGYDHGSPDATPSPAIREQSEDDPKPTGLTRVSQIIGRVIKTQAEVSAKRIRARELRVALRYKRDEEADARNQLLKRLNALFVQGLFEEDSIIVRQFEKVQSVAESYLALENSYNQVEDELEDDEYALRKKEEKFSDHLQKSLSVTDEEYPDDSDESSDDSSSTVSDHDSFPPLLSAYLSRLGDIGILRERLSELKSERLDIIEKRVSRLEYQSRQRVRKESVSMETSDPIDTESQDFLSMYDERKTQAQKELHDALEDAERLRVMCEDQGLLKKGATGEQNAKEQEIILEDTIPESPDPLMTSESDDCSPFFEQDVSQELNRRRFINKWILHRLRHSSVEILRLKSTPALRTREMDLDGKDISRLVLKTWFLDDAAGMPPARTASDKKEYRSPEGSQEMHRPSVSLSENLVSTSRGEGGTYSLAGRNSGALPSDDMDPMSI